MMKAGGRRSQSQDHQQGNTHTHMRAEKHTAVWLQCK